MKLPKFNRYFWGLLAILAVAFFLRFINISWGLPYYFHPDEWNMASAVTRLSWQNKLDPEFYAYGQLPLYLSFFSAKLYHLVPWITLKEINPSEAIFFLRFWSALAGVGTVYLVYLISKGFLFPHYLSLITALLASFTPGLIQISHFGTTEALLSFFFLAILYFSLKILEKPKFIYFLWSGVFLGLALGTKISALIFLAPFFLATIISLFRAKNNIHVFWQFIISLPLTLTLTLLTSPYLFLNFKESLRILTYETQIARGIIPVFYTRQFFNTAPVFFQLQKIFPYALGWPIFILGGLGIILIPLALSLPRYKKQFSPLIRNSIFIILFSFGVYFLFQAFLFCKWTRFMAPIFAFFPIFAVFFLQKILSLIKFTKFVQFVLLVSLVLFVLPGVVFSTIYFRPDIRFTASEWISKNIPSGAKVLSETGNAIDIPLPRRSPAERDEGGPNISPVSFDFYHLYDNQELFNQLLNYLETSDYIFVPSRRIFANHQKLASEFPKTAKYYELLFSGKLGFTETKVFHPFPQFQINDEQGEETFTVFDHPTIRIYEKSTPLTKKQYEELFH